MTAFRRIEAINAVLHLVASRKFVERLNNNHRQCSSSGCKVSSQTQKHLPTTPARCSHSNTRTSSNKLLLLGTAVTAATNSCAEQVTSREVWVVEQIPSQIWSS